MLINAIDPEESRIAVVEDGVLQELHVELASREAYLGNIYKGKVVNIEPSIGAAQFCEARAAVWSEEETTRASRSMRQLAAAMQQCEFTPRTCSVSPDAPKLLISVSHPFKARYLSPSHLSHHGGLGRL